jgi:hypothetical protein
VEGSVFGMGLADDTVIRDIYDIGALSQEAIADCIDPQLGNVLAYPTPFGVGQLTPGIQEKSLARIPLSKDIRQPITILSCFDYRTKRWSGI